MARSIRLATVEDGAAVRAIYAPEVAETPISFEVEPPSVEEMQQAVDVLVQLAIAWGRERA